MTFISFLDRPRGREIARMNANPTNNTLSIEPEEVIGGGGFCLLYRNPDLELRNVTLDGSLSLDSSGFLQVVGGPSAGSISVTTDPSGSTFPNITQVRIKDDQGLFAISPASGIAEIQYANVNIIASQSLRAPNVYVDNIDVAEGSNVYFDSELIHVFGNKGNPGVVNSGLDQGGSTLKISGIGVGQYLPSQITAPSWPGGGGPVYITPISATQPCTTQSNPVTGFTSPPLPSGDITVAGPTTIDGLNVPDRAALEIYGDAAGPVPYYAPGGFTPIQWYDKAPHTTSKALVAQRNLHFSETEIEITPPTGFLPADPFSRNVLEVRNYAGPNVFAESYIGIFSKDAPWDTKLNRWEWKVHDNYNIDMLPNSYKSNINEVNKISHIVDYGSGKTHVSFATNLTGGTDVGFIFTPSGGTVNDPSVSPDGIFSLNIAANTIFDADANELVVQRTKNASATNSAALRVVGGLGVGRNSHFGDSIFINSNVLNDSVMTIRPHDLGTGFTEITYDSSNTFAITVPHFGSVPGPRVATKIFSANDVDVIIGNDVGFTQSTQIVRGDAFGRRTKITLSDDIDINSTTEEDLASNIYGYTPTNPLIHCENDFVNFYANSFQIYSNLNTDRPIANISQTDVIFGESSNNFSANFKLFSNSAYVFEQTGDHIKIGLQDTAEKAQMYINTTPMSEMYSAPVAAANTFNMWAQSGDGTVGDYRVLSTELRRTFLNGAPVAATGTTVTINPDATQYAALRVVNRNGDDVRFGGTPQADGFGDAITQFGMGLNFHSDTTANLTDGTTFQSRIAKSFVFDETVDTLAWYPGGDSPTFSTLKYVVANDTGTIEYGKTVVGYSDLATEFSNTTTGNVIYVNTFTSNITGNTLSQPWGEVANTVERVISPIISLGDGKVRSLLSTYCFEARGYIQTNAGDTPTYSDTNEMYWNWGSSGFQFLSFQLGYAAAGTPSYTPDGDSTQGRLYAPEDGWITGVYIKFYSAGQIRQGGGGGYINLFKQFIGFYLGKGTKGVSGNEGPGRPTNLWSSNSAYWKPACVQRYLGYYQVSSDSPGTTETFPAYLDYTLPSEDWVYVEKGKPLPYVSMTMPLTAGAGASPDGPGQLKIVENNSGDAARIVTAMVTFAAKPPEVTTTTRGDNRWDTGTAVLTPTEDPVCG